MSCTIPTCAPRRILRCEEVQNAPTCSECYNLFVLPSFRSVDRHWEFVIPCARFLHVHNPKLTVGRPAHSTGGRKVIKALEKSKPLRERRYLTAFFGRADIASYPVALVFGATEKIRGTKSEP